MASFTHFINSEQSTLIYLIVFLILRLIYFYDIIQYYPKSYKETLCKANIKRIFDLHCLKTAIKARYHIPKENERAFLIKVYNLYDSFLEFTDPVLFISGNGFKLLTNRNFMLQVRDAFGANLNQCFILEDEDDISTNNI